MKNDHLPIENLLDDLLNNKISKSEAEAALQQENVANIDEAIELHFAAAKAVQRYNVLQQVQKLHDEFTTVVQPAQEDITKPGVVIGKIRPLSIMLKVAAALLLLVGVWFAYQYGSTNSKTLYSEIYQPYYVNTERGIDEAATHEIVPAFKKEHYPEVIRIFETLPASNSREKFLAAYAYHATGNFNKSLALFQAVIAQNQQEGTRLYNDAAEFYSGLAYLKLNDYPAALKIFTTIRNNPNHTFYERINRWTLIRLKWL